jgi:hypothetical protein
MASLLRHSLSRGMELREQGQGVHTDTLGGHF